MTAAEEIHAKLAPRVLRCESAPPLARTIHAPVPASSSATASTSGFRAPTASARPTPTHGRVAEAPRSASSVASRMPIGARVRGRFSADAR